jgi:diaminohydroxyphosphoribosylaminopyrimidine deaminase/5-amino-6-(5-phosphoribosylamino)uracil reductase
MDPRSYMKIALALAERGRCTTRPNPAVGAVMVKDGAIIGEGWHARAGEPHAEVLALEAAGDAARGATLYLTLEPCSHQGRTGPCADAVIAAGVTRVVAAMQDPNPEVSGAGFQRLRDAGIEVEVGPGADAAWELNRGFITRMELGRPWVRVKMGASLDGRTALPGGESHWITSQEARTDVQRLRAEAGCILTGMGTVLADDPRLDLRLDGENSDAGIPQPVRAILDTRHRLPADARMFSCGGPIWVYTADAADAGALHEVNAAVIEVPRAGEGLDLEAVLADLAEREINLVQVEAGPTLVGALFAEDLVDELVVYQSGVILGADSAPLLGVPAPESMDQRSEMHLHEVQRAGPDLRITWRRGADGEDSEAEQS